MKIITKFYIGIGILVILSPLGVLLVAYFKAGSAWGEGKVANLWNAPFSGYNFKGWEGKGILALSFAYIISAIIGIVTVVCFILLITKFLSKKSNL